MCAVLDVVAIKKGGITPALLPSEPVLCSPMYKSLGFLGKCARERGFMPCMAGLFALGHGCFSMPFGLDQRTLVSDMFGYVDVGGECME